MIGVSYDSLLGVPHVADHEADLAWVQATAKATI